MVKRRRAGHWRASSALTRSRPRRAAAARRAPGRGHARARQALSQGPRHRAPAGRRGCRRSPRSGRAAWRHPTHMLGYGRGTAQRPVRCPPSASMLFGGTAAESEFHDKSAACAPSTAVRPGRLAAEYPFDQLDESPVAGLDGVQQERRWVVDVWHGRSSRGSSGRPESDVRRHGTARRPCPTRLLRAAERRATKHRQVRRRHAGRTPRVRRPARPPTAPAHVPLL